MHSVHVVRPVTTDIARSVVCVSVFVLFTWMYCAKTAQPIEMAFRFPTLVGPRNHVLERVKIGRIHLHPRGVTSRQCDLSSNYFGPLIIIIINVIHVTTNKTFNVMSMPRVTVVIVYWSPWSGHRHLPNFTLFRMTFPAMCPLECLRVRVSIGCSFFVVTGDASVHLSARCPFDICGYYQQSNHVEGGLYRFTYQVLLLPTRRRSKFRRNTLILTENSQA